MPVRVECNDPRSQGGVCIKQRHLDTADYYSGLLSGFQGTDEQREAIIRNILDAKAQFEAANPCSVCIAYTRQPDAS